ncbi:reverse transcriptase domain-containing protein [Wolbachia endosymbiont of Drosophila innubila]|uniref:reverse transcriptase domain-containing protein n=1 Tax=Wolbachia endosymbiont of Drosophila innubila TaxID=282263 RepID=UPI0021038980|nr:reverse transcriptase domain-containing protein [Wolbachia endosymbiont of Drosophila innubila]
MACHLLLASRNQLQWILEGDIKGCFDNINHEWLMKHIPMEKKILHSWLKSWLPRIKNSVFHNCRYPTR